METPSKIKPALIGGVTLGLLSVIPYIKGLNCACCGWVLFGGALAAYIYIKDSPVRIMKSDGAAVGALAGFIGGIVASMVNTTVFVVATKGNLREVFEKAADAQQDAHAAEMVRMWGKVIGEHFLVFMFATAVVSIIIHVAMGAIGGAIGVSLFEKRSDKTPPPNYPYPPGAMPGMNVPPGPPMPPVNYPPPENYNPPATPSSENDPSSSVKPPNTDPNDFPQG